MEAAIEAIRAEGTGTTGSRIANGSYSEHVALEKELAEFYGKKHCMVFTTGYQANLGVISSLVGPDDFLLIDADSHASIYDACKQTQAEVVRFKHNDPSSLEARLRRLGDRQGNRLVVLEGIYSMLGDSAPLGEFIDVCKKYGAYVLAVASAKRRASWTTATSSLAPSPRPWARSAATAFRTIRTSTSCA
jgi:8-amino-7-oxononanoate synthase